MRTKIGYKNATAYDQYGWVKSEDRGIIRGFTYKLNNGKWYDDN